MAEQRSWNRRPRPAVAATQHAGPPLTLLHNLSQALLEGGLRTGLRNKNRAVGRMSVQQSRPHCRLRSACGQTAGRLPRLLPPPACAQQLAMRRSNAPTPPAPRLTCTCWRRCARRLEAANAFRSSNSAGGGGSTVTSTSHCSQYSRSSAALQGGCGDATNVWVPVSSQAEGRAARGGWQALQPNRPSPPAART